MKSDVLIVGCGAAGLFCALNLPEEKEILILTKSDAEESDSFLAQGGICVLRDESDFDSYFEDTLRAGHYENNPASVETMIRSSPEIIRDLVNYGVDFQRGDGGEFAYTKEGAHSKPRILFHEDVTGREITSKLLRRVRERKNIRLYEHFTMVDILERDGACLGVVAKDPDGGLVPIFAGHTVLATGGIGGLYRHSTNYRHLTADALAIALKHGIRLENVDYIQVHPTTLYSEKPGRRFLISESVRGEGAVLLNRKKERFVDELQPRDVVTAAIYRQMAADGMPYVWLSMAPIPREKILSHFPHIYDQCLAEGYDVTRQCIPVVPAQHYFMGGIWVDGVSKTSMEGLYAVGETSCNGVHGRNRLASNSLLESLVFAKRAAGAIGAEPRSAEEFAVSLDASAYDGWEAAYREAVFGEIERMEKAHGFDNHESKCR